MNSPQKKSFVLGQGEPNQNLYEWKWHGQFLGGKVLKIARMGDCKFAPMNADTETRSPPIEWCISLAKEVSTISIHLWEAEQLVLFAPTWARLSRHRTRTQIL